MIYSTTIECEDYILDVFKRKPVYEKFQIIEDIRLNLQAEPPGRAEDVDAMFTGMKPSDLLWKLRGIDMSLEYYVPDGAQSVRSLAEGEFNTWCDGEFSDALSGYGSDDELREMLLRYFKTPIVNRFFRLKA